MFVKLFSGNNHNFVINWFCGVVGYHFCLTHRRSPVRTRAESLLLLFVHSFYALLTSISMSLPFLSRGRCGCSFFYDADDQNYSSSRITKTATQRTFWTKSSALKAWYHYSLIIADLPGNRPAVYVVHVHITYCHFFVFRCR